MIARSDEAKKLGIEMDTPYFTMRPIVERFGIRVRSSNYKLYGDMSGRVMATLGQLTSDVEIYWIDEAFCDLSGFMHPDLTTYAAKMRDTVRQWTGIPVSIGIGPTKTPAKAANNTVKNADGVLVLQGDAMRRATLALMHTRDVWGISRQHTQMLTAHGVITALALADLPDVWIRANMHVTGLRTVYELRAVPCILTEGEPAAKKRSARRVYSAVRLLRSTSCWKRLRHTRLAPPKSCALKPPGAAYRHLLPFEPVQAAVLQRPRCIRFACRHKLHAGAD